MKTQIFSIIIILSITLLVSSAVAEDKKAEKDPNAYEKGSVAASLRQSLEAAGAQKGRSSSDEQSAMTSSTQVQADQMVNRFQAANEQARSASHAKVVHKTVVVERQPAVVYQQAPAPQVVVVQQPQPVVYQQQAAPRNFTVMAGGSTCGSRGRSSGFNLGGLIRIGSEACGYPLGSSLGTWGMSPGEQEAYERGLIKEQGRLQRDRERDAYNAGRTAARRGW